jgi:hypothetical protein
VNKHYTFQCFLAPQKAPTVRKRPRQQSIKEKDYQVWLKEVARPFVIARDGDICQCCKSVHYPHDLDHIKNKGSHPELKRSLDNLQILGRFPCHRHKTDGLTCPH